MKILIFQDEDEDFMLLWKEKVRERWLSLMTDTGGLRQRLRSDAYQRRTFPSKRVESE